MLNITKSITLNGQSKIGQDLAATMNATFTTGSGAFSLNTYISNQELYDANKGTVRADIEAFQDEVYALQDEETGSATDSAE